MESYPGNIKAFLSMIAYAEIGYGLLDVSDNGYNVLCSSTPARPYLFYSYDRHPRRYMRFSARITSSAAGRYQFLYDTWLSLTKILGADDFSPALQDAMAIQLITEKKALPDALAGRVEQAIYKCRMVWASFPGDYYGQGGKSLDQMLRAFRFAGGIVEGDDW